MSEQKRKSEIPGFVICDTQKEYAEHLLKIIQEEFSGRYQFHLFHTREKAEDYFSHSDAAVLLAGEEPEKFGFGITSSASVFVLTEDPEKEKEISEVTYIFRYQSAEKIISKIRERLRFVSEEKKERPAPDESEKTRVIRESAEVSGLIGIYSPVHRIGKTKFAIRLGRQLAEQFPVLYISLEGYSGENYYFRDIPERNLGDLIYSMKQEWGDLGVRISSMAGRMGEMDYISPIRTEQDLRSVRKEEWIRLFDMILDKCIYRAVILDIGDAIDGLYDILRKCSRIYTPYINEGISAAKMEQYERNLVDTGYGDILYRTVKRQVRRGRGHPEKIEVSR